MGFEEAFHCLDYKMTNPRRFWTDIKPGAVCITVWRKQIRWQPGPSSGTLYVDMWELHPEGDPERTALPKNWSHRRRFDHLCLAHDNNQGWLDVILLMGTPGEGYEDAFVWDETIGGSLRWRVAKLEPEIFFFRIEAHDAAKEANVINSPSAPRQGGPERSYFSAKW